MSDYSYPLFNPTPEQAAAIEKLARRGIFFCKKRFMECAARGDAEAVDLFLEGGIDVNSLDNISDGTNKTALILAAENGHAQVVRQLLAAGADVEMYDEVNRYAKREEKHNALWFAAGGGHTQIIDLLLNAKANIHEDNGFGETALIHAAEEGQTKAVKLLLDSGANLHKCDIHHDTALNHAARQGHTETALFLIKSGLNINGNRELCSTPLMHSAENGQLETVQALLKAGANPFLQDSWGKTALYRTAEELHREIHHFNLLGPIYNHSKPDTDFFNTCLLLIEVMRKNRNEELTWGDRLLIAAHKGDIKRIRQLLSQSDEEEYEEQLADVGACAMLLAAKSGHINIIRLLLSAKTDHLVLSRSKYSALMKAAQNGMTDEARLIINAGADVNADDCHPTPLILASENGFNDIVELLIATGAKKHHTPNALALACRYGHFKTVETLLKAGCDPNHESEYNADSALIHALQGKHASLALIQLLVEFGADVNADTTHSSVFMEAARHCGPDILQYLIDQGAKPNIVLENGNNAIVSATLGNNMDALLFLLKKGILKKQKRNALNCALTTAAGNGNTEMVKFLLNEGANINATAYGGNTALSEAVDSNDPKMVRLLLDAGASPTGNGKYYDTVLEAAVCKGETEIADILLRAGAVLNARTKKKPSLLIRAIDRIHGKLEMLDLLLAHGAKVNAKDTEGMTALMHAVTHDKPNMVQLLLKAGADITLKDKGGKTAIDYIPPHNQGVYIRIFSAAGVGEKQFIVNVFWSLLNRYTEQGFLHLLKNCINVNMRDDNGRTPLMVAARNGYSAKVKHLIDYGADIDATDDDGMTALMHASTKDSFHTLEVLLDANANVYSRDKNGYTALAHAALNKNKSQFEQLINKYTLDYNYRNKKYRQDFLTKYGSDVSKAIRILRDKIDGFNSDNDSDLHLAAYHGYLNLTKYLLYTGTDVNIINGSEETALMQAAQKGHDRVINLLCNYGANENALSLHSETALMLAIGKSSLETVKQLFTRKNVNLQDSENRTALMRAAALGKTAIVDYLIKNGAYAFTLDNDENDALDYALNNDRTDTALLLKEKMWGLNASEEVMLKARAELKKEDMDFSVTRFFDCIKFGHIRQFCQFLLGGIDVNARDCYGVTGLMLSAQSDNPYIVKGLIARGADIHLKDQMGWTALIHAWDSKDLTRIIRFSLLYANDSKRLSIKEQSTLKAAVKHVYDAYQANRHAGNSYLLMAIRVDEPQVATMLIRGGANVHYQNDRGQTALMMAAESGNIDLVKLLLSAKANVTERDKFGYNAPDYARKNGHENIVAYLKEFTD